ncbi:MAG TPA: molybdate ABC transporter substrate-binding protein [Candidatus Dormibacteraeota bacterium]|nr:molybdate ABC transporter substrate-binding protein [Candidatus Dormibacteraeota bacterium]
MRERRSTMLGAGMAMGLLLAACGGTASQATPSPSARPSGTLTVLAAASLTEAFTQIGNQLQARNPGLKVRFSFAGSPTLVTQIQQGAPADVFASADQANMEKVVSGGFNATTPRIFAHNRLEIAVHAGNPKHIRSVYDLTNPGIRVDECAPAVPCGSYATTVFKKAGITVTPVSQEQDVKSVLTKVALGEADAGIVYVSDVKSAGSSVAGVEIPDSLNVVASYPIVELKSAPNPVAARVFIEAVLNSSGQQALERYGFTPVR